MVVMKGVALVFMGFLWRDGCDSGFVVRLTRRPTKPTVAPITPSENDITFFQKKKKHMSSHSVPLKATVEPLFELRVHPRTVAGLKKN